MQFLVLLQLLATVMVRLGESLSEKTKESRNSWNRENTKEETTAGLTEVRYKELVKNYDALTNCARNRVEGQISRENKTKQIDRCR